MRVSTDKLTVGWVKRSAPHDDASAAIMKLVVESSPMRPGDRISVRIPIEGEDTPSSDPEDQEDLDG